MAAGTTEPGAPWMAGAGAVGRMVGVLVGLACPVAAWVVLGAGGTRGPLVVWLPVIAAALLGALGIEALGGRAETPAAAWQDGCPLDAGQEEATEADRLAWLALAVEPAQTGTQPACQTLRERAESGRTDASPQSGMIHPMLPAA